MAICPDAQWRPLPQNATEPRITARVLCFHTMVGSLDGTEGFFARGSGGAHTESHFGVGDDGRVFQWIDTARQADAQAAGNAYSISVETEDRGDPNRPWTPAQLGALVDLGRWVCTTHHIPRRLALVVGESGIGYHAQFSAWNPNRHACPGAVRIRQLKTVVIPRIAQEDDVPLTEAEKDQIAAKTAALVKADIAAGLYRIGLVLQAGTPNSWFKPETTPELFKPSAAGANLADIRDGLDDGLPPAAGTGT